MAEIRHFLQQLLRICETDFRVAKITTNKSGAYLNGEDLRLNPGAVEVYDNGVQGLIINEGERNRELINAR
ncbi:hypothetical protein P9273_00870 [Mesorhizobium sp. WSM4935]|uniref:hypothetical protein n=1 Tax=Mesorhizobium sp. WSM4935 TaxID=3038547 RepID=UPI0024150BB6|nr:hypothetical protein [Mesorhizobium sp. WSM4935]MDG4873644.1 hypothetical protein [Mesorhizobium sp. WSM4935]